MRLMPSLLFMLHLVGPHRLTVSKLIVVSQRIVRWHSSIVDLLVGLRRTIFDVSHLVAEFRAGVHSGSIVGHVVGHRGGVAVAGSLGILRSV